jgi:hypothetical protein
MNRIQAVYRSRGIACTSSKIYSAHLRGEWLSQLRSTATVATRNSPRDVAGMPPPSRESLATADSLRRFDPCRVADRLVADAAARVKRHLISVLLFVVQVIPNSMVLASLYRMMEKVAAYTFGQSNTLILDAATLQPIRTIVTPTAGFQAAFSLDNT